MGSAGPPQTPPGCFARCSQFAAFSGRTDLKRSESKFRAKRGLSPGMHATRYTYARERKNPFAVRGILQEKAPGGKGLKFTGNPLFSAPTGDNGIMISVLCPVLNKGFRDFRLPFAVLASFVPFFLDNKNASLAVTSEAGCESTRPSNKFTSEASC